MDGRRRLRRLCNVDGCGRLHYGRGWCVVHYQAWCRHRSAAEAGGCAAPGCGRGIWQGGYCVGHYFRARRGAPLAPPFLPRVDRAAVFTLRAAGLSERAIAARLGASRSEVNGILRGLRQPQGAAG